MNKNVVNLYRQKSAVISAALLTLVMGLNGCTITASSNQETLDYRGTAKAPALDIPPDLMRGAAQQSRSAPTSALQIERETKASQEKQSAVTPATVAAIRQDRAFRYLEINGQVADIWNKVGEFFRTNGLIVDTSDAQTGVISTQWQENLSRTPGSFLRRYVPFLAGVASSGELDRYQAIVESAEGGKVRVYIAHYGLVEEFTADKTSSKWLYRPSESLLALEMLKKMAVFFGLKNPELTHTSALPANEQATLLADGIILPQGSITARRKLLLALSAQGFEWQSAMDNVLQVRVPTIMNSSPLAFPDEQKKAMSVRINLIETQGQTLANFSPALSREQLQKIADAING